MRVILSAATLLLISAAAAQADNTTMPWIIHVDVSDAIATNQKETFQTSLGTKESSFKQVDNLPGGLVDIGYYINQNITINGSTGLYAARGKTLTAQGYDPVTKTYLSTVNEVSGNMGFIPLVAMMQYHFDSILPGYTPYVGLGAQYTIINSTYHGVSYDTNLGAVADLGLDAWVDTNWALNADVRYYEMEVKGDYSTFTQFPGYKSTNNFNPIVLSLGMAYHF